MLEKREAPQSTQHCRLHTGFCLKSGPFPTPHASPGMAFSITKPKLITLLLPNRSACLLKGMGPPTASLFMLGQHCVQLNSSLVQSDEHNGSCCAQDPPFSYSYSAWASEAQLGSHFPPEAFPDIPISLPGLWALLCAAIEREHLRTLMSMLAAQPRGKENWIQTTKLRYWLLCLLIIWQEIQPHCKMGLWSVMVKCEEIQTRLLKFTFFPFI